MADHVYIEDIAEHVGEEVTLKGWLHNLRSSGKLHFMIVRDGTGFMQGVAFRDNFEDREAFKALRRLPQETSLVLRGAVKESDRAPHVPYELDVRQVEVVREPTAEYPLTPVGRGGGEEHGVAFLMEHRHLWLREPRQVAILRVRHRIIKAIRDFFDDRGFTLVDAPIFTPSACEGTSTLFETQYFSQKAYLTQSGQLYMEAAAMALGKVYCFGPTFRAEKSKTRRHLTEFWMVEPEVAYLELDGVMALAQAFVQSIVAGVLEDCRQELDQLERDTSKLEACLQPFARLHYDEAVQLLKERGSAIEHGADFGGEDETILTEGYDRPIMVHRYPAAVKAFYMKRDAEDATKALGVDVLAPEGYGEIIGGGEREWDLEKVEQAIAEHRLPKGDFEWYLDVRRYGSVPHGGFGLGIERTVAWICGLHHVRETIPFPRLLDRMVP